MLLGAGLAVLPELRLAVLRGLLLVGLPPPEARVAAAATDVVDAVEDRVAHVADAFHVSGRLTAIVARSDVYDASTVPGIPGNHSVAGRFGPRRAGRRSPSPVVARVTRVSPTGLEPALVPF